MTLTITNSPGAASDITVGPVSLVSLAIGNDISAEAEEATWHMVDVPPGRYQVVAFNTETSTAPIINVRSTPFFVVAGNTGCTENPISTSPISMVPSPTAAPQGNDASAASSTHKGMSPGALAGTIIGVVAGVILLLLAITYPRIWRRSFPIHSSRARRAVGGPYVKF